MRTEILKHVGFNTNTKKRTNISVDLVYVTPEVAKNYLKYNTINRKESLRNVSFLTSQMLKGQFLENGESIVFDINNNLTDGAHRLKAIIKSNKSFGGAMFSFISEEQLCGVETTTSYDFVAFIQSFSFFKYPNLIISISSLMFITVSEALALYKFL